MKKRNLLSYLTIPRFPSWLSIGLAPMIALSAMAQELEEERSELLDRIELRSVVSLPGETLFSLHDPESDLTFWIERGQTRNGLEVVAFDAQTNRIQLRHGEFERELGLSRSRGVAAVETSDQDLSRAERREQRRAEWQDFRQRWEEATETNPQIQEITSHYEELQQEWQSLRRDMRGVDRDSEEFDPIRERVRALRDEQRLLNRYAAQAIAQTPGFTEDDVERANRVLQGNQRGR
jgi:hypothetical protein